MTKHYPQTIDNIPSGILSCFYEGTEVPVISLSKEHIQIRIALDSSLENISKEAVPLFSFHCFFWDQVGYVTFGPFEASVIEVIEHPFFTELLFEIQDVTYQNMVSQVEQQLYHYITNKLHTEGNDFSKALVDYPSELDDLFPSSYEEWLRDHQDYLSRVIQQVLLWQKQHSLEIALALDSVLACTSFLENKLACELPYTRIYVGNSFCHNQFPEWGLLEQLLHQATTKKISITIVLSYLKDALLPHYQSILQKLFDWCVQNKQQIELELNDYGWFLYFEEHPKYRDYFVLLYGPLINKRRKDPRRSYKHGLESSLETFPSIKALFGQNNLSDEAYIAFTKEYHISRYEQETCGFPLEFPILPQELQHTLHLPLYQTNTSQYCPLQALLKSGNRGNQKWIQEACNRPCEQAVLLYPSHLHMIGRYNSIFALDTSILEIDMEQYHQKGVNRILWNL